MKSEQRNTLKRARADIIRELGHDGCGHVPNFARIARVLADVLPILGGFCARCNGSGIGESGICPACKGKSDDE